MAGMRDRNLLMTAFTGLLALAPVPACAADPALIEAARREGEVVWYSGMIVNQAVRPLTEAFERKYPGIKVKASRHAPPETVLKIPNEGKAGKPQADVFDGSSAAFPLIQAKRVEPYVAESAAPYPAEVKDANGHWTSMNLYITAPAVNTELVKAVDVPKTFEDLL